MGVARNAMNQLGQNQQVDTGKDWYARKRGSLGVDKMSQIIKVVSLEKK